MLTASRKWMAFSTTGAIGSVLLLHMLLLRPGIVGVDVATSVAALKVSELLARRSPGARQQTELVKAKIGRIERSSPRMKIASRSLKLGTSTKAPSLPASKLGKQTPRTSARPDPLMSVMSSPELATALQAGALGFVLQALPSIEAPLPIAAAPIVGTGSIPFASIASGGGGGGLAPPAAAATPPSTNVLVPAVPEPGTWAMMIIGFGAIGAVLRSGRSGQPGRDRSARLSRFPLRSERPAPTRR